MQTILGWNKSRILIVVYSLLDCWCFWCGYLVLKSKHIGGVLDWFCKVLARSCPPWQIQPTLFTLFTNDLPSSVKSGELFMYADDTTVYCIGENVDQAIGQLNKALEELYTWCPNNRNTHTRKSARRFLISRSSFVGPIASVRIDDSFVNQVNKWNRQKLKSENRHPA